MNKTILLLTLISTINLTANSFSQINSNTRVVESTVSQKYFYAKRAAEKGNARAQFDLGVMYATGNGVEKNEKLALKWFNIAAQNNFSKRQEIKNNNRMVSISKPMREEPVSQQFLFAKRAADKGNVRAQFDLAMMYLAGNGVRKNEQLAFKYFHTAARNNSVEAKFQMGLNFSEGRGVKKQEQLAKYWFKLASKSGHPTAMAHLASLEGSNNPVYKRSTRIVSLSPFKSLNMRTF